MFRRPGIMLAAVAGAGLSAALAHRGQTEVISSAGNEPVRVRDEPPPRRRSSDGYENTGSGQARARTPLWVQSLILDRAERKREIRAAKVAARIARKNAKG